MSSIFQGHKPALIPKSNSSFSKDLAKQKLFEFIFYYSFHVSSHPYVLTFLALKKHVELGYWSSG